MRKFLNRIPGYSVIEGIFLTATFRQSGITFIGTFINGILGAAFYILSARFLGPALFGLLSVSLVTLALVADIGDFGTNTGLVRFVSKFANEDLEKANRFLKLGFKVKLAVSVLVIISGFFLAPYIADKIFSKHELVTPLRISFVGVSTTWFFSFITVTLQSFQKFWKWSGIQIMTNFLRLSAVVILLLLGKLGLHSSLLSYIIMPFIGFLMGLTLIPKGFIKAKNEFALTREFFQYNKWVALFIVISSVGSRLDTFLSARLLTAAEVGLYSAATQLTQVVPQIIGAIGTVISPKIAGMRDIKTLLTYYKKTQLFVIGLSLLGLLAIPIATLIIPILYGKEYLGTISIFIVLLCAMLIFLISVPIHNVVLYYFSYPKLFSWMSGWHLIVIFVLGWIFIERFGVIGGAIAVLVAQTFDFIIPAIWVYRKVNNKQ